MGRRTRTTLPTYESLLQPVMNEEDALARSRQKQEEYYNRSATDLSNLKNGDTVCVQPERTGQGW